MAKRKRGPPPPPPPPPPSKAVGYLGAYVTEIGIPEVDRLMHGRQFRYLQPNSTCLSRIGAPNKVPKMMKGHKFPKVNNNKRTDDEDRISRLPDDILQFIISCLTLRDGVATSVLSTRWRYLWTASFTSLNFDVPNMLGFNFTKKLYKNKCKRFLSENRPIFATRVNHVFKLCRASRLDALRMSFGFGKESASHIDRWIESAAAQGVTDIKLDFDVLNFIDINRPEDRYEFPAQQVASSLKHLHLVSCIFRLPPTFTGFTSLVTLSITYIVISQPVVDCILSKCPLLEFLSLGKCQYAGGTPLKFVGPSLLLKHLRIWRIMDVELQDVSLLSLELTAMRGKLSIRNAPHLARLVLDTKEPVEVLSNLPRLKTLFLSGNVKKCFIPNSSVLNNLKCLVIYRGIGTTDLHTVVSLLENCHLLQELEIDISITDESSRIKPLSDTMMRRLTTLAGSPNNNLKKIEIYGFHPLTKIIELVKYLLKYAVVLEKMKIYTPSRWYKGNGKWSLSEGTPKTAISLEEVYKMLQRVARSSTKLELFTSFSQSVSMPA